MNIQKEIQERVRIFREGRHYKTGKGPTEQEVEHWLNIQIGTGDKKIWRKCKKAILASYVPSQTQGWIDVIKTLGKLKF